MKTVFPHVVSWDHRCLPPQDPENIGGWYSPKCMEQFLAGIINTRSSSWTLSCNVDAGNYSMFSSKSMRLDELLSFRTTSPVFADVIPKAWGLAIFYGENM